MALGLENLSEEINKSITGQTSDPGQLASGLSNTLSGWLKSNVYPVIFGALIFITVLFVFYGSFLYFTAYGDENRAMLAKKTITYAFIGLIIALLSFGIASYVQRVIVTKTQFQQLQQEEPVQVPTGQQNKPPY